MNIIFISTEKNLFVPGSTARLRIEKYTGLAEKQHIIVCAQKEGVELIAPNIWVYGLQAQNKLLMGFEAVRLALKIIRENNYKKKDTLISAQDPFEVGLISLVTSKLSGLPLHAQIHVDFFNQYYKYESVRNFFQYLLSLLVMPFAKELRVVSPRIENFLLQRGVAEEKISFIPVFADLEIIREKVPEVDLHKLYPEFETIILMTARLSKQKNFPLALKAFAEVVKSAPKSGLVLVGSGSEKIEVERLVKALELTNHVRLIPWSNTVTDFMKTADIFLMSSNYEGYPLTIFEASAARLCIVMTDVGCAGDYIKDNESGLVVKADDVASLANALTRVLKDQPLRERLAQGAYQESLKYRKEDDYHEAMRKSYEKTLK